MKINNLKDSIDYLYKINHCKRGDNTQLDYNIDEGVVSKEWYESILEEVKKLNAKRVIDIGSNLNMFGYLFENEGIEYIGVEESILYYDNYKNKFENTIPVQTKHIKLVHANYYDVKEAFKYDVIISCLCVGYLIPTQDVIGKHLIVNSDNGQHNENYKCLAKVIY